MADQATTVLIVDDQMPFRMAARTVVGVTPGFEVVGEAKSGEEAVEQVATLHPELVLMDINMDGISGIEATRRITAEHPGTKVILLSTYDEEDLPGDARTCGALGYVHKEQFGPDVLIDMWSGDQKGRFSG
ncbi:MAG TPA: response regulator transcription factor [Acidimicrobiales bacterium]